MSATIEVNNDDFKAQVLDSDQPVLVDFWAPWCGPCRKMGPVVDQIADELAGRARVVKVDVDQNPTLSAKYGVNSIPTFMVFKGGDMVQGVVGGQPKKALLEIVESHLD